MNIESQNGVPRLQARRNEMIDIYFYLFILPRNDITYLPAYEEMNGLCICSIWS